jgi:two-component system, OmpR family, sensor histidine kinase VicK
VNRTRVHHIVEADRTYLELLMDNLLSNAHKYSPPGARIEVVYQVVDREALIVVLDHGIGMSEAEAARLFASSYRIEAAKKRANGLGVGLAVCKQVAETQGGRIWARPRASGGSEVGFALPLAADVEGIG